MKKYELKSTHYKNAHIFKLAISFYFYALNININYNRKNAFQGFDDTDFITCGT